jgi:ABC-type amino acid transport substrate-binding protein/ABC-type nitrate/sulfonate/bicarbonate transport system substrate-binding protein
MIDRACGPGFQNHPRRGLCGAAICMLILLSVFPALAAQSALEPVTIQLRWFHQFQFAGYYAAIEKGFYADEGLQVSLRPFQPGQDRIAPVLKGNAQYGVGDPGLLALRDQGKLVVVLAQIFQHSPAVLISRRESGIFSADELVGKRVMLPLDDIGSVSIQAMILNEIGDLNRITVVPYAYNDEKFTKGEVDAMSGYLSNEPYKLKIKGVAVNIIDPRSYSIDFYGDNLFTTEKEVVEHPERVNKVIRATLKGWAYALKHKDDIIDLILTKYNPNLNREQLRYEAKMIDQMIVPDLVPIGEINPKRYDRIAETYHRLGMITASSVPDGFIYAGRPEPAVSLTTQERAWLKAHPDITLGYADSFEPLLIVNDDGTFSGVLFDILEALNKKLGTNIGLRINSVPKILEMAQKKEVDGVLSLHPDYAAELRLLATDGYINAYPTVFARKEDNFTGPADFAGKNVAILDKVYFSEDIIQQYGGQANIVRVTNVAEGLQKVQNGSVDFFIGLSSNNYTLQKYRLGGLESKHTFFDFTDKFGYAVRSDWLALVSILNKGISSFSEQEIESLVRKWMELPLQKQAVALNPEERAWLDAHPDITLGYTDAFEPEVIVNPDGNYRGILVDILAELNSRLGTRIRLRIDPIPEVLEKVQEKEIDGILSILPDYAEKLGLLKTRRYITSYPTVFARRDVSFNRPSDLAGKRVAVIDKVFFSEQIVRKHGPGATVLKVKDAKEGLQLIGNRQADFFLGATLNAYLLTQYQLLDLANQYVFFDHPINNVIGTRSDWPELSAILNKGLASFSNEEIESISAKWIQLPQPKNIIQLTAKEKAWLAQKHIVQVRVVNIPPYIILKEGAEPEGISIDYLNFIAERTGVKFEFRFSGKPFPEALDGLIEHSGPDLISSMLPTPEREKSVLFSKDYYRSPYVIFTHNKDKTFISDMTDLYGRKIALPKGTVVLEKIKKDYPDLKLVLFDNDSLAIEAVATEKADAYIGNLTLASFLILEKGLSGLKIAGPSPFGDHVLSMGIRNDWPALVSIIDKALATMSQEEHAKIRNKYVAIRYDHAERAAYIKWFAIISGAALLASLLFVFWNRQLAEKVKKRTAEIRASRDYLKSLTDSMPDAVFSVSMTARRNDPSKA